MLSVPGRIVCASPVSGDSGVKPFRRPAAVVMILKIEPGGSCSCVAWFSSGFAGLPVASHYVAGWSQWSGDPTNPVARNL